MTAFTPEVTIGGHRLDSSSRPGIGVFDPADYGELVGIVPALTPADITAAYGAAAGAAHVAGGRTAGPGHGARSGRGADPGRG